LAARGRREKKKRGKAPKPSSFFEKKIRKNKEGGERTFTWEAQLAREKRKKKRRSDTALGGAPRQGGEGKKKKKKGGGGEGGNYAAFSYRARRYRGGKKKKKTGALESRWDWSQKREGGGKEKREKKGERGKATRSLPSAPLL